MSAVYSLDQVLACTESATVTSEYSTTSHCLSALLGTTRESEVYPRRAQMVLEKEDQRTYHSHTTTAR